MGERIVHGKKWMLTGGCDSGARGRKAQDARCSHAFANALTIYALTLQIAVVWTRANNKLDVLNVMFLKSAACGSRKPDICAHITA
jgi:hypothetical protein